MSQYMNSNPLAEHNAGIALSSKQIPVGGGGTGNMYQGQAGRAFVQGGGGSRRRKRSNKSKRKVRKTGRRNKKCGCDIVTGFGGLRSSRRMRTCRRCKSCRRSRKQRSQSGGSNAAFSIAGSGTEVGRNTTALANPAPYTAYNSCHPVL